ncbi:MAG: OsmC family protein [Candidatus Bathyarchaeia archaeon]
MAKIKVTANWVENVRSVAENSRGHKIVMDMSKAKGGTDVGPTALESAIMSLADCAVTIFADVCKQSNIELTKMVVEAEAEKPDDLPILTGVNMKVKVNAKARQQLLDAAWRRTEANCPVVYIFKENIPINVEFQTVTE